MTDRGHQNPSAFLIMASGLDSVSCAKSWKVTAEIYAIAVVDAGFHRRGANLQFGQIFMKTS